MFNLVQPVFNPNGSARPVYDQILPNMAKNGRFWGPPETPRINFGGSKWVKLFNRCSTQIGQLGPSMAKYFQIWPKMAFFGHNFVPRRSKVDPKVEHLITWPNWPKQTFGFLGKKKIFLTPPPFNTLCIDILFRPQNEKFSENVSWWNEC